MKNFSALLLGVLVLFITSCKKDKVYNPDEVRLIGTEMSVDGNIYRSMIEYNSAGKISKISHQENDNPAQTSFDILYVNNEVFLINPPVSNSATELKDTIKLQLGTDGRVTRRMQFTYFEAKPPGGLPQRTFKYDTTVYQYNAAGMLLTATHNLKDSTWFDNGIVTITVERTQGVTNYAVSGGNLVSSDYSSTTNTVARTSVNTYTSTRSNTSTTTFEYSKPFPNKTDFSNVAILNEVGVFADLPLNRQQALLPSKVSRNYSQRDQSGTVVFSDNSSVEFEYKYNFLGFVTSRTLIGNPNSKLIYKYSY